MKRPARSAEKENAHTFILEKKAHLKKKKTPCGGEVTDLPMNL
jgi:hypothetical protein